MSLLVQLKEAREAYLLGRRLQKAVERGRRLHPWLGVCHATRALEKEVVELKAEVRRGDWLNRGKRITEEAIDCAVVAIRIAERR